MSAEMAIEVRQIFKAAPETDFHHREVRLA
jgi:hypothetical protein